MVEPNDDIVEDLRPTPLHQREIKTDTAEEQTCSGLSTALRSTQPTSGDPIDGTGLRLSIARGLSVRDPVVSGKRPDVQMVAALPHGVVQTQSTHLVIRKIFYSLSAMRRRPFGSFTKVSKTRRISGY
ncbi:MAG: hypothetical protein HOQ44_10030 [Nocardia sp.]|nr:hypothetical protein [Nocardia sp.]